MRTNTTKLVTRIWRVCLAVLAGIAMPLLVWVASAVAFRQMLLEWRALRPRLSSGNILCSLDTECPPGYQCAGGRCLPRLAG